MSLYPVYKRKPLPPRPDDAERWKEWCDGIEARIEALRAAEAPVHCAECGCSAHPPAETRQCPLCGVVKGLTAFARNRQRANGRAHECRECKAAWLRENRRRNKVRMFKQAVRGVAS